MKENLKNPEHVLLPVLKGWQKKGRETPFVERMRKAISLEKS